MVMIRLNSKGLRKSGAWLFTDPFSFVFQNYRKKNTIGSELGLYLFDKSHSKTLYPLALGVYHYIIDGGEGWAVQILKKITSIIKKILQGWKNKDKYQVAKFHAPPPRQ